MGALKKNVGEIVGQKKVNWEFPTIILGKLWALFSTIFKIKLCFVMSGSSRSVGHLINILTSRICEGPSTIRIA